MKIFAMLCWRNIWRHKRRSVIILSAIAFGIFAMIVTMSILNGITRQFVDNNINLALGHISIQKKGFQENMKLDNSFTPANTLETLLLEHTPPVTAYAPRLKVEGMIQSSRSSRGVMAIGIDPHREMQVSEIERYMETENGGAFLDRMDSHDVLISRQAAQRLDLMPGEQLVLMVQNARDEIVGTGLTVAGIFNTPIDSLNQHVVYMGIEKLQEITGIGGNVSEITVVLENRNRVNAVQAGLLAKIGDTEMDILSWMEMSPSMVNAVRILDIMMYISFGILFITVVFSIANTLIMAIMERFHEIGIMKSIGTKPSWIFSMILFESVNLGLIGLVAGIIPGIAVVGILSATGVDFTVLSASMQTIGVGTTIYPAIKSADIIAATVIILLTTISAAYFPARKAVRINPLAAITFQ